MTEPSRETLVGRLLALAADQPDAVAIREKRLGIWVEQTWSEYRDAVEGAARALWRHSVRPGDSVGILSDNRREWLFADLGAQSIGARSVGIYQTSSVADVDFILRDSAVRVLLCENQEQVDKVVDIDRASLPRLEHIVVFDPRGTRDIDDDRLLAWSQFLDRRVPALDGENWWRERVSKLDPSEPSMVVYTSGTTGSPKGALLSPVNALAATAPLTTELGVSPGDSVLSYLPLCHVAEKIFSVFFALSSGCVVHFGESIETVQADLREVSPTIFLGVPRIWEKMFSGVSTRMEEASPLKRRMYRFFLRNAELAGSDPGIGRRALAALGDWLVFRPLRDRLGLGRCWLPLSGAAPIAPELLHWYERIGLPVCEGYGQTECGGVSHLNPRTARRVGSVGAPVPTVECRLAADGEVLLRGPVVFCGYLNQPEATAATVTDGWLHTGDLGTIDDDGYLTIVGRKKEIIITAGGKNLSPEKVENALKTSAYVKEAVAVGDRRKHVAALIQVDRDVIEAWAARSGVDYVAFEDLVRDPKVRALIDREVETANAVLSQHEQVRRIALLPRELDQELGEVTATQKIRRSAVQASFSDLIESLYEEGVR